MILLLIYGSIDYLRNSNERCSHVGLGTYMREDIGFRSSVTGFGSSAQLWDFLKISGFEFDQTRTGKRSSGEKIPLAISCFKGVT